MTKETTRVQTPSITEPVVTLQQQQCLMIIVSLCVTIHYCIISLGAEIKYLSTTDQGLVSEVCNEILVLFIKYIATERI